MDNTVTQWINAPAGHYPLLDMVMIGLTSYGVPIIVLFVVAQWWSRTDRSHVRHTAISAGLSFLLALAINQVILLFVHRVRPYDAGVSNLIIARSGDWSFPSDHATASVAVAAAFLLQGARRRGVLLAFAAAALCWSRVYVGTHYVTDVLGGAATGLAGALLVRKVYHQDSRLDRMLTRIL